MTPCKNRFTYVEVIRKRLIYVWVSNVALMQCHVDNVHRYRLEGVRCVRTHSIPGLCYTLAYISVPVLLLPVQTDFTHFFTVIGSFLFTVLFEFSFYSVF